MLEAVGLQCIRGYHTLFENLDLRLASGELLLVEGHNGCGKTSLLKILSGLREADAGDVLWAGQSIRTLGAEYRQQFLWLGHQNGIKEDLTALENLRGMVAFEAAVNSPQSPLVKGEADCAADDSEHHKARFFDKGRVLGEGFKATLTKIGLSGNANRYPRHFSAGMKRRLALCRLLLSDAPLWILDEPQSALDREGVKLFESLLEEHLAQGGSVVMTSHHDVSISGSHITHLDLAA